jgi:hypothetical protein
MAFDPTFDVNSDAGGGDPDATSPTLRAYHQLLWSKPLPDGHLFTLEDDDKYLSHSSSKGQFLMSSDAAIPTWRYWERMAHLIREMPEQDVESFYRVAYQLGGMMMFPRNQVDGLDSLNQAKGKHPLISDRLDLTIECIRLYYAGVDDEELNPLGLAIARYSGFFDLFGDFDGYVGFWLLQDMISADGRSVDLFLSSDGFTRPSRPATLDDYAVYREKATAFVEARNRRMLNWVNSQRRNDVESKDSSVRMDSDAEKVIEPETWTAVPKYDLWLEGILDYSELAAEDKGRADRLLSGELRVSCDESDGR